MTELLLYSLQQLAGIRTSQQQQTLPLSLTQLFLKHCICSRGLQGREGIRHLKGAQLHCLSCKPMNSM